MIANSLVPVHRPKTPVGAHHPLDIAPHVGREARRLDEQLVEAHAENGGGLLDQPVTRRLLQFPLDARPVGRRAADPPGEVVEPMPSSRRFARTWLPNATIASLGRSRGAAGT